MANNIESILGCWKLEKSENLEQYMVAKGSIATIGGVSRKSMVKHLECTDQENGVYVMIEANNREPYVIDIMTSFGFLGQRFAKQETFEVGKSTEESRLGQVVKMSSTFENGTLTLKENDNIMQYTPIEGDRLQLRLECKGAVCERVFRHVDGEHLNKKTFVIVRHHTPGGACSLGHPS